MELSPVIVVYLSSWDTRVGIRLSSCTKCCRRQKSKLVHQFFGATKRNWGFQRKLSCKSLNLRYTRPYKFKDICSKDFVSFCLIGSFSIFVFFYSYLLEILLEPFISSCQSLTDLNDVTTVIEKRG